MQALILKCRSCNIGVETDIKWVSRLSGPDGEDMAGYATPLERTPA